MGRLKGFGVGRQGFHPRARGSLSPTSGARGHRKDGGGHYNQEMTSHYFVPSFSIRRHLDRLEEDEWRGATKQIGGILGRHFDVMPPADITIKTIEQKALIHKIRQSGQHPTAEQMRETVFNIRDDLTNTLANAPDPITVGVGRLAVFGRNRNKLAFTLDGWKGWRARYDDHELTGEMSSLGALLVESRVAIGNIATSFPEMNFAVNDIATSPHITIASTNDTIRDHELRRMQSQIDELEISTVMFGDPIINYKLGPELDSQTLHVRHSWSSLVMTGAEVEFEYGELAS